MDMFAFITAPQTNRLRAAPGLMGLRTELAEGIVLLAFVDTILRLPSKDANL